MTLDAPQLIQSALMLRADWNWRRGPKWRAALAWMFGQRQFMRTHKGHLAEVIWWLGEPYLVSLAECNR